mmetsp:Transcript_24960/g.41599  ORF Transcript_24960/g.41599 Transcript_24960/m.41599 type:complete len:177 (-) Transcript_24960:186-716(-)
MTTVLLSGTSLRPGTAVPPQLQGSLTQAQFDAICHSVKSTQDEMCCISCAIEWGVCIFFGLFCVFCCHPCIQEAMAQEKLRQNLNQLNQVMFQSKYVLGYQGRNLIVNTANIPQQQPQQLQQGSTTVVQQAAVAVPPPQGEIVYATVVPTASTPIPQVVKADDATAPPPPAAGKDF